MSAPTSDRYDLSAPSQGRSLGCSTDPGFEPRRRRTEMERYLGVDVHGESCTFSVLSVE